MLISSVEPLSLRHHLVLVGKFTGEVLYNRTDIPDLRAIRLRAIPQEHINLDLPISILEIVVEMPHDRCDELYPALCGLLDLLLMGQTAAVLNGNKVSHLLIQPLVLIHDASYEKTYF